MIPIDSEYVFSCGGEELAKVLVYYGFISDTSSSEYKIVCPFHNDINPSMIVNLDDGSYFCFGCNETGNAMKFVRSMNKDMDDLHALIEYFRILKSDKCMKVDLSQRTKRIRKTDRESWNMAHDYYYGLSKIDWENSDLEEAVEAREYMKQRGFTAKSLTNCRAKITYNKHYGLIFPMMDNGRFKGWVCRTMVKSIEKKRKYLYNEGFSRATTLVGNYKGQKVVYVVEGYMDMLKTRQNGVHNVVAILGWKMTSEQIQKLKDEGVEHLISALDNDECGREGTKFLERHFTVTRFCYLKGVKDPGEMTKQMFDKMNSKTVSRLKKEYQIGRIDS